MAPASRDASIFVNCPFDAAFEPLLEALLFTVVAYGFTPTSALTSGDAGQPRISRIYAGLVAARYSLHDLSRCRGEGDANLARFNMPLELGMAVALSQADPAAHTWLALVPTGTAHGRYVSDLAGFDLVRYDGTPADVALQVGAWLAVLPGASRIYPAQVVDSLPAYGRALVEVRRGFAGMPPWPHLVRTARTVVGAAL